MLIYIGDGIRDSLKKENNSYNAEKNKYQVWCFTKESLSLHNVLVASKLQQKPKPLCRSVAGGKNYIHLFIYL